MTASVLKGTPVKVTFLVYSDGTAKDFDATPTHTAVDAVGTSVTLGALSNPAVGQYDVVLLAQDDVKIVTVTLAGDIVGNAATLTQDYEIIGGYLFTEAAARTFGAKADGQTVDTPLTSATSYPDPRIISERDSVTFQLEQWCARSFVPRYGRIKAAGNGTALMSVGAGQRLNGGVGSFRDINELISVTINDVDQADLTVFEIDPMGYLSHKTGVFPYPSTGFTNIEIEYEYGLTTLRDNVERIGLLLLVQNLVPRMPQLVDVSDFAPIRPGGKYNNRTYDPEVNQWINDHNMHLGFG